MSIFEVSFTPTESKKAILESGDETKGWQHIKKGKEESFRNKGLNTDEEIQQKIKDTAEDPLFVYNNASRNSFELYSRYGSWIMKVILNKSTGVIITAMPISGDDGDYSLQRNGLIKYLEYLRASGSSNNIALRLRVASVTHLLMDFLSITK